MSEITKRKKKRERKSEREREREKENKCNDIIRPIASEGEIK